VSRQASFHRRPHTDSQRYVIYVLWLIGFSQRAIGTAVGLRTKQVAGILENAADYRDRAGMGDTRRAELLAELVAIRVGEDGSKLDRGILDRVPFTIRPLNARQHAGPLRRKLGRGG
jgi:hypothetical protein